MIWSKSRLPSAPIGRPRSVVVTGASSGIGHASALMLARSEFRDFAGVRNEEDAGALEEAATAGGLSPLFIDVTDENLVARPRPRSKKRWAVRGSQGLSTMPASEKPGRSSTYRLRNFSAALASWAGHRRHVRGQLLAAAGGG